MGGLRLTNSGGRVAVCSSCYAMLTFELRARPVRVVASAATDSGHHVPVENMEGDRRLGFTLPESMSFSVANAEPIMVPTIR